MSQVVVDGGVVGTGGGRGVQIEIASAENALKKLHLERLGRKSVKGLGEGHRVSLGKFCCCHCFSSGRIMRHVFGANGKNLEKEGSSWEKMGSRAQVKQQEGCPLSKRRKKKYGSVRGTTDWNRLCWAGTIINTCVSYLTTGRPGKECRTNKLPPTGRIQERSEEERETPVHVSCQPPESFSLAFILAEWCNGHQEGPRVQVIGQRQPKTNPITIKPETTSHMAEQSSWVPSPCYSLPWHPFPIKSLALSAHVSPQTVHFQVLDKSPLSSSGMGPPSCNKFTVILTVNAIDKFLSVWNSLSLHSSSQTNWPSF